MSSPKEGGGEAAVGIKDAIEKGRAAMGDDLFERKLRRLLADYELEKEWKKIDDQRPRHEIQVPVCCPICGSGYAHECGCNRQDQRRVWSGGPKRWERKPVPH